MVDFEAGSPAWDIGMILTRHASGHRPRERVCAMVHDLRVTAAMVHSPSAEDRLAQALATGCDCGAKISDSERTSILRPRKAA